MEVKILIRTPKDQARKTEKRLRLFLLKNKRPDRTVINYLDNEICWIITDSPRKIRKLTNAVTKFDFLMRQALNNRAMRFLIKKKLKKEQKEELMDMLLNQTQVEVINKATEEELAKDEDSVFHKIKNLFKVGKEDQDNSQNQ
jgi:hypothetical protein